MPDAILCADLHIRADTPLCRTDDYFKAQENKVNFIFGLALNHLCPILIAGDLGDKSQWPNWLLEWFSDKILHYGISLFVIPGQHDLPNHKLDNWRKSGIGVLSSSNIINLSFYADEIYNHNFFIDSFPYGKLIDGKKENNKDYSLIAIAHQMVIENKPLWPDQKAPKGHELLKKFPQYDLILTGDNHNPFVSEYEGRLLVNPGSMMRMKSNQEDHKPRVYIWYKDTNTVEPVYLPIEDNVISREHIEREQSKDKRIKMYAEKVKEEEDIELSYKDNMKEYFGSTRVRKTVKDKVWESIPGG